MLFSYAFKAKLPEKNTETKLEKFSSAVSLIYQRVKHHFFFFPLVFLHGNKQMIALDIDKRGENYFINYSLILEARCHLELVYFPKNLLRASQLNRYCQTAEVILCNLISWTCGLQFLLLFPQLL